ncbi:MAG: hypothetical protein M1828_000563 [Chrysothrix sp. TS-e1954]|nr:MAG: hypothetical protein M1828_000563 [Chrysothrix sp. TS-e1954]
MPAFPAVGGSVARSLKPILKAAKPTASTQTNANPKKGKGKQPPKSASRLVADSAGESSAELSEPPEPLDAGAITDDTNEEYHPDPASKPSARKSKVSTRSRRQTSSPGLFVDDPDAINGLQDISDGETYEDAPTRQPGLDELVDLKSGTGLGIPAKKRKAYGRVPDELRQRKKPAHRNPTVRVAAPGEEVEMTDQILMDQRAAGAKWSEINPLYQDLTNLPHAPGASTLPNRYRKLMATTHNFTDEQDDLLLETKKRLEATWDNKKWNMLAIAFTGTMGSRFAKKDVYPFDASMLRRRYEELVPHTFAEEVDHSKRMQKARKPLPHPTTASSTHHRAPEAPMAASSPALNRSTRMQPRRGAVKATAATAKAGQSDDFEDEMMAALAMNDEPHDVDSQGNSDSDAMSISDMPEDEASEVLRRG